MNVVITPGRLQGTVMAPPSKSEAHRLLIAMALADKPSRLRLTACNADVAATMRCLEALGAQIKEKDGCVWVQPIKAARQNVLCDCGESGSTLRFITPVAAALGGAALRGCGRLAERPMEPLLSLLRGHGCAVSEEGLPLKVSGGLKSGTYALRGDISSQFVTGLLYALPLLEGDSEIVLTTPLQSRGYVEMTLQVLRRFGIAIQERENAFVIPGRQRYTVPGEELTAEGDWSGAAFWYGANFAGGDVRIEGLRADSAQGDKVIAQLTQMLPDVMDVGDIPDLLPVLSVMACKKQGDTRFVNAYRLRSKESDRLEAGRQMIQALGGSAETTQDTMTVHGTGCLAGGVVDGMNDHRIVMSAAIAACLCEKEVTILGAEAANKSYPAFWKDFEQLGGKAHVL